MYRSCILYTYVYIYTTTYVFYFCTVLNYDVHTFGGERGGDVHLGANGFFFPLANTLLRNFFKIVLHK